MKTRRLDFYHEGKNEKCNGKIAVCLLFLVEGFELWVDGICQECGAYVRTITPLEQLISMTPNPSNKPFFRPPLQRQMNNEDKDFLRGLGIEP